MDIAHAQQFLREHENAVLATWRRDGRLQMSPVTVGLDTTWKVMSQISDTLKIYDLKSRVYENGPEKSLCELLS